MVEREHRIGHPHDRRTDDPMKRGRKEAARRILAGRPEPDPASAVIELDGVSRVYRTGGDDLYALRDVSLSIRRGEMVAIVGPSGSGKSTLMNVLGCLDRPTSGRYRLAGHDVAKMDDDELADARNRLIGFVFQNYGLLPRLTAIENVELPLIYRGLATRARRDAAREALERVGLADRLHHRPNQLSGGQQQRVAIARALAGRPELLLADEPTGNLDSRSGREVMALVQELNEEGMTVVLVTHDAGVAAHCRRAVTIRDGSIERDEPVDAPLAAARRSPAEGAAPDGAVSVPPAGALANAGPNVPFLTPVLGGGGR
jgi:putative ABC transport system ATP-binding protein